MLYKKGYCQIYFVGWGHPLVAKRGKLNLILGIVVIFVWAIIWYQVLSRFLSGDETEILDARAGAVKNYEVKGNNEGKSNQFVYTSLERDPFFFGKAKPVKVKSPSAGEKKKDTPPQILFNLIGIVTDNVENLAIIEEGNTTKFLKKGDTIGNLTIKRVDKDRIMLNNGEVVRIK